MSAPELVSGHIIAGKFTVRRCLGRKAHAATYHAITAPSRDVALKVFDPSLRLPHEVEGYLRQSMDLATRLPSRVRLAVLEIGIDASIGAPYMASELSLSPSLAELVQLCPLGPDELVVFARNLGAALAVVHAGGRAHLALRPTNIFVGAEPRFEVRLADFGAPSWTPGEDSWAAPERRDKPSAACDVHSAALVMMFAMTGHLLADRSAEALAKPATALGRQSGGAIDGRLDAPFARALSVDPTKRHRDVSELAEAIALALGAPPVARAESPSTLVGSIAQSGSTHSVYASPSAAGSAPTPYVDATMAMAPTPYVDATMAMAATPYVDATMAVAATPYVDATMAVAATPYVDATMAMAATPYVDATMAMAATPYVDATMAVAPPFGASTPNARDDATAVSASESGVVGEAVAASVPFSSGPVATEPMPFAPPLSPSAYPSPPVTSQDALLAPSQDAVLAPSHAASTSSSLVSDDATDGPAGSRPRGVRRGVLIAVGLVTPLLIVAGLVVVLLVGRKVSSTTAKQVTSSAGPRSSEPRLAPTVASVASSPAPAISATEAAVAPAASEVVEPPSATPGPTTPSVDVGKLTVQCSPSCTSIEVDGEAATSFPAVLPVGAHEVVAARGGGTQRKRVTVARGRSVAVAFYWPSAPSPAPAKAPCGKFLKRCD